MRRMTFGFQPPMDCQCATASLTAPAGQSGATARAAGQPRDGPTIRFDRGNPYALRHAPQAAQRPIRTHAEDSWRRIGAYAADLQQARFKLPSLSRLTQRRHWSSIP